MSTEKFIKVQALQPNHVPDALDSALFVTEQSDDVFDMELNDVTCKSYNRKLTEVVRGDAGTMYVGGVSASGSIPSGNTFNSHSVTYAEIGSPAAGTHISASWNAGKILGLTWNTASIHYTATPVMPTSQWLYADDPDWTDLTLQIANPTSYTIGVSSSLNELTIATGSNGKGNCINFYVSCSSPETVFDRIGMEATVYRVSFSTTQPAAANLTDGINMNTVVAGSGGTTLYFQAGLLVSCSFATPHGFTTGSFA